jgi:hypothetical protein
VFNLIGGSVTNNVICRYMINQSINQSINRSIDRSLTFLFVVDSTTASTLDDKATLKRKLESLERCGKDLDWMMYMPTLHQCMFSFEGYIPDHPLETVARCMTFMEQPRYGPDILITEEHEYPVWWYEIRRASTLEGRAYSYLSVYVEEGYICHLNNNRSLLTGPIL